MKKLNIFLILSVFFSLLFSVNARAVPVSFLRSSSGNMNDIDWYLLQSQNIQIYYDQKAYGMSRYALYSIHEAYPYLSSILGVKIGNISDPIINYANVISSTYPKIVLVLGDRAEGPGFANPVTQNIEAQMIRPRSSAFFQHELVHRLMYEHNDFHIGAPGRLFSLAMMPTWWIEGLAEYFTQSMGRIQTAAFIRNMSQQNYWPSWERLHSLYNANGDTNTRGYATSGEFVGWIFENLKEKDLFKIHQEIASETVVPFFYTATDRWLKKKLNKTGKELYDDFIIFKKKEVEQYLNHMPKLLDAKIGSKIFSEERVFKTYSNNNKFLLSKMTVEKNIKQSQLIVNEQLNSKIVNADFIKRIPLSIEGSSIIAVENENESLFLSTNVIEFSNASYGNNIVLTRFKGNIFKLEDKNILSQVIIPFATEKKPLVIEEIKSAGNGGFFIHASLRGDSLIYFYDAKTNLIKGVRKYIFPIYPKFIGVENKDQNACVISIINKDNEKTSIEKTCANLKNKVLFKSKKLNIIDGFPLGKGKYRFLVSWDKVLALVDVHKQKIEPLAAFPELIHEIKKSKEDGSLFTGWVYEKGHYELFEFDVEKLKNSFKAWQASLYDNSIFANFPSYEKYEPPFKKIYAQKVDSQVLPPPTKSISTSNKKLTNGAAPGDHDFLFAFPYALPDVLGGPSINLVAIPYQDKIERDVIQIFGGYNFYLEAPSGTISYINNRILDGFVASVFASPLFNGTYQMTQQGKNSTYYNYLLEKGVSLGNVIKFKPSTFKLQQLFTAAKLEPYARLDTPPSSVGAQTTNLYSIVESLSFNLFQEGFYLAEDNNPYGSNLTWKTDLTVGGGKFNSFDGSKNAQGKSIGNMDYFNVNTSMVSTLSYRKHVLTLTGRYSTTQGPKTFNLREYYSPYQTYILGSGISINYISFPFIASDSLFDLNMGSWSRQGALNYEFPIFEEAESLFLMSYVDRWVGFFAINAGGVTSDKEAVNFDNLTTLSMGFKFTLDIKGFQIYPSISYTHLVEKAGWGIIMQIKLMDFT